MSIEGLSEARSAVMGRLGSLEAQGCLPIHGVELATYTAFFDGIDPDLAARAVWDLIWDETLTHDPHTDDVDRKVGR